MDCYVPAVPTMAYERFKPYSNMTASDFEYLDTLQKIELSPQMPPCSYARNLYFETRNPAEFQNFLRPPPSVPESSYGVFYEMDAVAYQPDQDRLRTYLGEPPVLISRVNYIQNQRFTRR